MRGATTYGIGGPARFFAKPVTAAEVAEAYAFAREAGLPVLTLGGGSNLLVADGGVAAVVLRLRPGDGPRIEAREDEPGVWRVDAAAPLAAVVAKAAAEGLAGVEFLAGVPGSVGGAAAMNAGGGGLGFGDLIAAARVIDGSGTERTLERGELSFGYRSSSLSGMTVLEVAVRFAGRDDPQAVLVRTDGHRERKRATQPLGQASAGCVFRNPSDGPAGLLLDRAGCKGMREGRAEVSGVHANFIVNAGGAGSADVARLAARMRERVRQEAGVVLEPEIRFWGDDPAFGLLYTRLT